MSVEGENTAEIENGVPAADVNLEGGQPQEGQQQASEPTMEDRLKEWAASKGRTVDNVEDLFVPVKETVEVNPYESFLDEDDKAYIEFKKTTGGTRTRKDWDALNTDWDAVDPLQLAREQARRDTGLPNLSNEQADAYIADTLGLDFDEDLSDIDKLKLAKYNRPVREEKKAEAQQYKLPAENKAPQAQPQNDDFVTVGKTVMRKADYDQAQADRQKFIEGAKAAVDSVTQAAFKVTFDDKGTPVDKNYSYDYSAEDKHSMVSLGSDLDAIVKGYVSETGFDHKRFNEDVFWLNPKNREKAFASVIHKAIAGNTMEVLAERGNVNLDAQPRLPQQAKDGVKNVTVANLLAGNI